jgi:zinc transporter ZupT
LLFEMPDRRAVWCTLPVLAIGFVHVISITVSEQGVLSRVSEYVLYCGIAILGVALGYLSIKEGFNVMRPSRTRESEPVMFWIDALVFVAGLPIAGAWLAWKAYGSAS